MIDDSAFIHDHAIVESDQVGQRTRIYAFVHILKRVVIGADCNINDHCFIEGDVVLGDRVTVKCGNYLWDGLRVEDDAFLGPNVVYTNDLRPRSKRYPESFQRIHIGRGASIGANSVLLGGITVGAHAMVGMGSVVTRDVPPYTLVFGNPARIRGHLCHCGEALETKDRNEDLMIHCHCGARFRLDPERGHPIVQGED